MCRVVDYFESSLKVRVRMLGGVMKQENVFGRLFNEYSFSRVHVPFLDAKLVSRRYGN